MNKMVLFASDRPLERAENLNAVWEAYEGEKTFIQHMPQACAALSDRFSVFVCDEIPQYSPTKGDIVTIFVSHGLNGDKKYGLDCTEAHRKGAEQIDYAVCSTEYARMRFSSQLGLEPGRILTLGFPMADAYFGKEKGDGGTILSECGKAYLYVPTWRAPNNPPLPSIDWRKLDLMMDDDEIIAVKRHMCTKQPIVGEELHHVAEIGNMTPSVPYLIDCDVLATDFSSILFDGYILGKPSVIVTDGCELYLKSHGMYEDYPTWYGSRHLKAQGNEEAFLEALREAHGKGLGKVERNVLETTAGVCDGHAAERVAELIARYA